jgi:hypothetical protein
MGPIKAKLSPIWNVLNVNLMSYSRYIVNQWASTRLQRARELTQPLQRTSDVPF